MAGRKDTERGLLKPPAPRSRAFRQRVRLLRLARKYGDIVRLGNITDAEVQRRVHELFSEHAELLPFVRTEAERTKYIHDLALSNPGQRPKELRKKADDSIIGDISFDTFRNHVGTARKQLRGK